MFGYKGENISRGANLFLFCVTALRQGIPQFTACDEHLYSHLKMVVLVVSYALQCLFSVVVITLMCYKTKQKDV